MLWVDWIWILAVFFDYFFFLSLFLSLLSQEYILLFCIVSDYCFTQIHLQNELLLAIYSIGKDAVRHKIL